MKKGIVFIAVILFAFISSPLHSEDKLSFNEMLDQKIKAQFFCGYCHVLSYPKVIKKAYNSWKQDKHKDVTCIDCHYPPERLKTEIPEHRKIPVNPKQADKKKTELEFIKTELEVLSKLITTVNMEESVVRRRPRLDDRSCLQSKCHSTTGEGKEGEFWTKKIKFIESERDDKTTRVITYVHETHFDKRKWVEGQEIHCTTCHQHETRDKHFEVSRKKCFLCHFKNAKLNEGRAKCSLCHVIPTVSLQRQKRGEGTVGEKAITHQTVEEAGVKCDSCHSHFIRGDGAIKQEKCLECHDDEKAIMKEALNMKLMHGEHVAGQNAGCFNCHEPIEHNKDGDFIDIGRSKCQSCHPDHHKYQKMLLLGEKRPGISKIPDLMFAVNTNCQACHYEEKIINGERVKLGTGKACAGCHTPKHEGMANEWKEKTASEAKTAREVKQDALKAIEEAKGKAAPQELLDEAMKKIEQGQENLSIVEYGGGVHNKKYSVMLIDAALSSFEEAIELFEEEEEEEGGEVEVDCECSDGELECADEDAEAEAKENECTCNEDDEVECKGGGEEEEPEVDCECVDGELECADADTEEEAEEMECSCDEEGKLVCEGG